MSRSVHDGPGRARGPDDELARLRARAYGGDEPLSSADAARLTELEGAARGAPLANEPRPTVAPADAPDAGRTPAALPGWLPLAAAGLLVAGALGGFGLARITTPGTAAPSPSPSESVVTRIPVDVAALPHDPETIAARGAEVEQAEEWDAGSAQLMVSVAAGDVWWGTADEEALTCVVVHWNGDTSSACGPSDAVYATGLTWGGTYRSDADGTWTRNPVYLVNPYTGTFHVSETAP